MEQNQATNKCNCTKIIKELKKKIEELERQIATIKRALKK